MIKMLSEVGIEGTNLNMTNPQPSNPQVESFSRSGTRQGHPLLVNILAVLARAIGQENTFRQGEGEWLCRTSQVPQPHTKINN